MIDQYLASVYLHHRGFIFFICSRQTNKQTNTLHESWWWWASAVFTVEDEENMNRARKTRRRLRRHFLSQRADSSNIQQPLHSTNGRRNMRQTGRNTHLSGAGRWFKLRHTHLFLLCNGLAGFRPRLTEWRHRGRQDVGSKTVSLCLWNFVFCLCDFVLDRITFPVNFLLTQKLSRNQSRVYTKPHCIWQKILLFTFFFSSGCLFMLCQHITHPKNWAS